MSKIQTIFLFNQDRLLAQAESTFRNLEVLVTDRARVAKWPEERKAAMLADLYALAERYLAEEPPGNQSGLPSSQSIGESSPAKAEGAGVKTAGCGSCK